eukprot:scaffold268827_cov41-Tisochrysis_lutea.AAC.1
MARWRGSALLTSRAMPPCLKKIRRRRCERRGERRCEAASGRRRSDGDGGGQTADCAGRQAAI